MKIKTNEELEELDLWDLLQYYKQCVIEEFKGNATFIDVIIRIELEVRKRVQFGE